MLDRSPKSPSEFIGKHGKPNKSVKMSNYKYGLDMIKRDIMLATVVITIMSVITAAAVWYATLYYSLLYKSSDTGVVNSAAPIAPDSNSTSK